MRASGMSNIAHNGWSSGDLQNGGAAACRNISQHLSRRSTVNKSALRRFVANREITPALPFRGYFSIAGDPTTIPTSDFKNGVDGGATHLPSWQLLERTTALGDDERDVIELGAGGELLNLFHNRSD